MRPAVISRINGEMPWRAPGAARRAAAGVLDVRPHGLGASNRNRSLA